jgi:hypothetical protein
MCEIVNTKAIVHKLGARISVRMPASARTRNVPNDAVRAATMLPTTIAGDPKSMAINTANAAKAAMLRRRSSSVSCRRICSATYGTPEAPRTKPSAECRSRIRSMALTIPA